MSVNRSAISQPVQGFLLIEALVTILIVSFGLLGLAGMLFSSMNAGQTSLSRSNAVSLANSMADKLRANWKAVKVGSFDSVALTDFADDSGCVTTCMTAKCTPEDQATLDICLWKAQLQRQLPGGQGSIAVDAGNAMCANASLVCAFDVTVRWNDNAYRTSGTSEGSDFSAQVSSYVLRVQP